MAVRGKVNPTILGVAALTFAATLLIWKLHSLNELSRTERTSSAQYVEENANLRGSKGQSEPTYPNKRDRASIDKTKRFVGEIEKIIRLYEPNLQANNGIDLATIDQIYSKLKEFTRANGISDEELHDIFLFNIGRDYPEISFALAIDLDPSGTGRIMQDVALRTMINRNPISDILTLVSRNGPSGQSLEGLVSTNVTKILAQDPQGLIDWVAQNPSEELGECITKNLTQLVGSSNFPADLRLTLFENKSTPESIRQMALVAESTERSKSEDILDWHRFVERITELETSQKSTEALIAAWPSRDVDGASKFLRENSLEIGKPWSQLLGRSLQKGEPRTIAEIVKDPNGQELPDFNLKSAASQIYRRDSDFAATLFDELEGNSAQEVKLRKYIFEKAISENADIEYLQRLIEMESDSRKKEEMRMQLDRRK